MTSTTKIMTVSYGTFSCTLEGFDDPFETMKAMAEYFRDLTAQNRFFGAEPSHPDPDKLQQIAQDAVQSPVESKVTSNESMHLRKTNGTVMPAMQTLTEDEVELAEEVSNGVDPMAAAVATAPANGRLAANANGGREARKMHKKLTRVREVVSKQPSETEKSDLTSEVSDFMGSAQSPEDVEGFHSEGFEVSEYDDDQDLASVPMKTEPKSEPTLKDAPGKDTSNDAPVDAPDEKVSEFEASDAVTRKEIVVEEITRDDLAKAKSEPQTATENEVATEKTVEPQKTPVAKKTDKVEAKDTTAADKLDVTPADENSVDKSENAEGPKKEVSAALNRVVGLDGPSTSFNSFSETFSGEDGDGDTDFNFSGEPAVATTDTANKQDAEDANRAEEQNDNKDMTERSDDKREARLARRDAIVQDEDAAIDRLMDATSSRLEDSENSGRRASIAHLKAAVAATKADASIVRGAAAKEEADLHRYREDLARVVRPGGVSDERDAPEKRAPETPSPLVLISEQRAEDEEETTSIMASAASGAAAAVVQKIAPDNKDEDTTVADVEPFTDYAKRMNALEMPHIMEAAAAHFNTVENMPSFTRPMLMRKVISVSGYQKISREDGLRAFGTLLRESKIVKDENGQFMIASTSKYLEQSAETLSKTGG